MLWVEGQRWEGDRARGQARKRRRAAGRTRREGKRGTLRGWKSIPLDGVTSRAQLAPARVSFRRGFRILATVDWRFLPTVSFLPRSSYMACVMRWLHFPSEAAVAAPLFPPLPYRLLVPISSASSSPSFSLVCPRGFSSSFIRCRRLPLTPLTRPLPDGDPTRVALSNFLADIS